MESPVPRRLSSSITIPSAGGRIQDTENMASSYEGEEERIVNALSRKLEQLRDEKIRLENIAEAEAEPYVVHQLSKELTALRQRNLLLNTMYESDSQGQSSASSPVQQYHPNANDPRFVSTELVVNALRRENEALKTRLIDADRDLARATKLNEMYRDELLELRKRLGLPLEGLLVGQALAESSSQPTHQRHREYSLSPVVPTVPVPITQRPTLGPLPIPRPPSQIHRPTTSEAQIALNTSASSPDSSTPASPFPFSPLSSSLTSAQQTGYHTTLTTPASVPSLSSIPPTATNPNQLTYPHVPPPSLSSSVGSPVAMFSPVNASSRRNSRVAETGSLVRRGSRGSSVDRPSRQGGMYGSAHGPSIAEQLAEALSR
ncbi:hypothetical protein FRB91_007226 [Serendipita sp. 411]|nr:hypothetical protein FRB91_007226 [Serendipita sp. 411]